MARQLAQGEVSFTTVEQRVTLQDTLIQSVIREAFHNNSEQLFDLMHTVVERFLGSFSFTTRLSPAQVETFTVDALERFSYESLHDAILFFKMARSGKFGVAKKGIDSNLVFGDWFLQYMELKAEAREKAVLHQVDMRSATTEQLQATYDKLEALKQHKATIDMIDVHVKTLDRQQLEDTIVTWEREEELKQYVPYLKSKRRTVN